MLKSQLDDMKLVSSELAECLHYLLAQFLAFDTVERGLGKKLGKKTFVQTDAYGLPHTGWMVADAAEWTHVLLEIESGKLSRAIGWKDGLK